MAAGPVTVWALDRLIYPDGPPDWSDGIDLTGRARIIIHGPYVDLPHGLWRVTARFRVVTEGQKLGLRFDWGAGETPTITPVLLTESGSYEITLDHDVQAPAAEIRIWVVRPSFGGRFFLLGISVERLPDQPPPNQSSQSS